MLDAFNELMTKAQERGLSDVILFPVALGVSFGVAGIYIAWRAGQRRDPPVAHPIPVNVEMGNPPKTSPAYK